MSCRCVKPRKMHSEGVAKLSDDDKKDILKIVDGASGDRKLVICAFYVVCRHRLGRKMTY